MINIKKVELVVVYTTVVAFVVYMYQKAYSGGGLFYYIIAVGLTAVIIMSIVERIEKKNGD